LTLCGVAYIDACIFLLIIINKNIEKFSSNQ
jgi:hypothetical protein